MLLFICHSVGCSLSSVCLSLSSFLPSLLFAFCPDSLLFASLLLFASSLPLSLAFPLTVIALPLSLSPSVYLPLLTVCLLESCLSSFHSSPLCVFSSPSCWTLSISLPLLKYSSSQLPFSSSLPPLLSCSPPSLLTVLLLCFLLPLRLFTHSLLTALTHTQTRTCTRATRRTAWSPGRERKKI